MTRRAVDRGLRTPRTAVLAAAFLALTVLACGDADGPLASDATSGWGSLSVTARAQTFAVLPAALEPSSLQARVRSADGTEVVKDTTLAVSPGQQLSLEIPVEVEGPDQPFLLELLVRSADGTLVYQVGPLQVVARLLGSGGSPQQLTLAYVGPGAEAARLEIVPQEGRVVAGETVSIEARAFSGTGGDQGSIPVEWSTLDPDVVTLEDEATGTFRGGAVRGEARVVALLEPVGLADTALIRVVPRTAELVVVGGDGQEGGAGVPLPEPLVVRVVGTDGLAVAGEEIAFTPGQDGVADPEIAVSDAEGLAVARWTPGPPVATQTLTASVVADPEVTASFSAEVGPAPLARILLTPDEVLFTTATSTRQLVAEGQDGFGNPFDLGEVIWSSSDPEVAQVDQGGLVTAVGNGTAEITATADGVTSEPALVSVAQVPVEAVIEPDAWTLFPGDTSQFTAEALDSLGQAIVGLPFEWSSSDTTVVSVTNTGMVLAVAPGSATITARLTSDALIQATSQGTVVLPPDPPSDVLVTATEGTFGGLAGYTVRWTDNSTVETRFQVERNLTGGLDDAWEFAGEVPADATTLVDEGPDGWPNDLRVLHRVLACRDAACSEPVESDSGIQYTAPNPAGNVRASLNDTTFAVTATWTDPNSFEDGYLVQLRNACSGGVLQTRELRANRTSFTFGSANANRFQVLVIALGRGPFDSTVVLSNQVGFSCGEGQ